MTADPRAAASTTVRSAVGVVQRSEGRPLDPATRADLEPRLRADFSHVRVHTDGRADESARTLNAAAYTLGRDVVFRAGHFAPRTPAGRRLLAHELTHVLQQGGGATTSGYQRVGRPDDAAEREADAAADRVVAGRSVDWPVRRALAGTVQRTPPPATPDWVVRGAGSARLLPKGAPARIFFDVGSVTVNPGDPVLAPTAVPIDDELTLQGYASDDELASDPTIVDKRIDAVRFMLALHGHESSKFKVNARPQPGRIDYRRVRSVEILRPGERSVEPEPGGVQTQPCLPGFPAIDAAFHDARDHVVNDFINPVIADLSSPVLAGSVLEDGLKEFFHGPANAAKVRANLKLIRAEIHRLATAPNYLCGTLDDSSCAGGAFAYNDLSKRRMVICPGYVPLSGSLTQAQKDDNARNLLHEAAHSTAGLKGVAGRPRGTEDFAYRFERTLKLLPLEQQLQNSDSYGLFVLKVKGGIISAVPPKDVPGAGLTGAADKPKFDMAERAVARVQKWISSCDSWITDEYGEVHTLIGLPPARRTWENRFDGAMEFASKAGFPLTLPPVPPKAGEDIILAAIHDRLKQLSLLLRDAITISLDSTAGAAVRFEGTPLALVITPDFLEASFTDDQRANLVLEQLLKQIPVSEISVTARPWYKKLIDKVRIAEKL